MEIKKTLIYFFYFEKYLEEVIMSYNRETRMYEGYIYLILNDINPEEVYVGQTVTTADTRWRSHISQIKNHTPTDKLHNKMEYYGKEHFAMEVIETHSCEYKDDLIDKLDEREIYYIAFFNSYQNGLNSTRGGRCNVDHMKRNVVQYDIYGSKIAEYEAVDDIKKFLNRQCVSSVYSCCYGEIKYAYGFIWRYKDDELEKYPLPTDKEIREAIIRIKSLGKIKQYSLVGELLHVYTDVNEAIEATRVSRYQIINSCSGNKVTGGGFVWRFECDDFNSLKSNREKFKTVFQYDCDGKLLNIYPSTREAARMTGVNRTSIGNVCRGHQQSAGGYIWSYVPLVLA